MTRRRRLQAARCIACSHADHRRCGRRAMPVRGLGVLCREHADAWLLLLAADSRDVPRLRASALDRSWVYGVRLPSRTKESA